MSETKISEAAKATLLGLGYAWNGFRWEAHPQPAELAEQQENFDERIRELEELNAILQKAIDRQFASAEQTAALALQQDDRIEELEEALAATGKQQVGDDGMTMVCVTQEFKDQADYDDGISSASSNLLRNNTLGLSGSLPEMVAALIDLTSGKQVGEVLTDTYVQTVPDKCDRIVWRGHYYHLPIKQVGEVQANEVQPVAHSDSQWIK